MKSVFSDVLWLLCVVVVVVVDVVVVVVVLVTIENVCIGTSPHACT